MTTIEKAIERSVSQNEIVTIDVTRDEAIDLMAESEDYTDVRSQYGHIEAWGTNENGSEWRVHGRISADVAL